MSKIKRGKLDSGVEKINLFLKLCSGEGMWEFSLNNYFFSIGHIFLYSTFSAFLKQLLNLKYGQATKVIKNGMNED